VALNASHGAVRTLPERLDGNKQGLDFLALGEWLLRLHRHHGAALFGGNRHDVLLTVAVQAAPVILHPGHLDRTLLAMQSPLPGRQDGHADHHPGESRYPKATGSARARHGAFQFEFGAFSPAQLYGHSGEDLVLEDYLYSNSMA
jgi:hypothetical protein